MKISLIVVAVLLILGGAYWYVQKPISSTEMGSYAYSCANGSTFSMEPAADVSSVRIFAGSQGMFTGEATLQKAAGGNARFEGTHMGSAIVFSGAGEEVQLTVGSETTVCNPVPNTEMAPWNWGDPGEGAGSVQPDVRTVVGESIVGKWQSTEDAKFVREFRANAYTDWYDGKAQSSGMWNILTKQSAATVGLATPFPLEDNAVYVQMGEANTDTVSYFKVSKLTPEVLELAYMDRGGMLTFTAVE